MEFHLRFYLPPLVYSLITSCRAMVISIIVDTGQTMAPPAFTTLRDHLEGRAFSSPFSLGDHLSLIPKSACSSRVLLSSIELSHDLSYRQPWMLFYLHSIVQQPFYHNLIGDVIFSRPLLLPAQAKGTSTNG